MRDGEEHVSATDRRLLNDIAVRIFEDHVLYERSRGARDETPL
jgi:hypothetical protein